MSKKADLFDACALVVFNDSVCDHRCVGVSHAKASGWGTGEVWGRLHKAQDTEWITESPRAVFIGFIGPFDKRSKQEAL